MTGRPVLFLCRFFPPGLNGSSILMRNLLEPLPVGSVHVIAGLPAGSVADEGFASRHTQSRIEMPKRLGPIGSRLTVLLYPSIRREARKRHAANPFSGVFVSYPFAADLVMARALSAELRLPLYVYMHDMWAANISNRALRFCATVIERAILRSASAVFAITTAAAEYFDSAYGISCDVLEHSIDWSEVADRGLSRPGPSSSSARSVAFTGAIYSLMNADSLRRVNEAVHRMPNTELRCCTAQGGSPTDYGLSGDRVTMVSLSKRDAFALLQSADIVCVPLAFETSAPLEVRTVFPTKLLDCLVSGRPILIHAPADSAVARDARAKGWGLVVSEPTVDALQPAMERLFNDAPLRERLVSAAWDEARRRDSRRIATELATRLSLGVMAAV